MGALGELTSASSRFLNKRGVYLGRRSARIHVAVYRRSAGRLGGHIPGWPKARIALLDHVGAKTGAHRRSPVMCMEDGEAIVVMASKAGQPSNPAWFHNLMAHPDTSVQLGSVVRKVHARVASADERARLWSRFLSIYPGVEFYERNAGDREIPIVVLEPRI